MARHQLTHRTSFETTTSPRAQPELWRAALGPGYAVGPSGRLVDHLARTSEAASAG